MLRDDDDDDDDDDDGPMVMTMIMNVMMNTMINMINVMMKSCENSIMIGKLIQMRKGRPSAPKGPGRSKP